MTTPPIPDTWRFYSADASIAGRCSVTLVRCDEDRAKWHKLSDEEKDAVDLYVYGIGHDLRSGFIDAISKCQPLALDYKI